MMTAHAFAPDIDAAYAAGADDYVVKPFSPRDLTARIEEALAKANRPVRRPALGLLATIATRAPHGNRLLEREVMPAVRRRSAAG
jgi:DNA-binding response OmpR family regulator